MSISELLSLGSASRGFLGMTLLLSGCVSQGERPRTEEAIASAASLSQAIHFETIAGPIDLTEAVPDTLTLPLAVRKAMATHPETQASLARARAALAEAKQSRLLPNPVLSVAVRYPEGGGSPTIEAGLAADLISLLQRPGRAQAADHRLRAASAQAISTALDVLAEVEQSYAAVQALDELMPVLEARRKLLDRLLEIAASRLRNGEGTQLDVSTLESQRVELDLEIAEKQLALRESRLALTRLVGQPSGEASWKLTPFAATRLQAASETVCVGTALQRRPEIQARRWELLALGGELAAARLAALESGEVGIDAERDGNWAAGPALSSPLPIFDWGQARRDRLKAEQIEAGHRLTQEQRRVVEEVRRAYAAYRSVVQALDQARDRLVPLARKRLEQAESQYVSGLTDITALVLAEQDLQTAQARRIELDRQAVSSLSRLQRAIGGPGAAAAATQPAPHVSAKE